MSLLRRALTRPLSAVAVCTLALGLASCSSDGGGGDEESSGSEGMAVDESVEFTGDPVKVLTMAPIDTEVLNTPAILEIAQGAVVAINNAGGLNGRELQLITCNEGFDPNVAAGCARDAVSEGVAAVVGGFTINADTVLPILNKAGIPWVGPPLVSNIELVDEGAWPVGAGILSMPALGQRTVEDGCTNTYSVATQTGSDASDELAGLVDEGIIAAGGDAPEVIRVPQIVADFSGVAQQLEGADCVVISAPPAIVTGIAAANVSLGASPRYYIFGGALTSKVIEPLGSALEGAITTSNYPVATDPAWDDAKAAVGDLADDANGGWSSSFAQNTWVAYQVFAEAVAELDSFEGSDVTAALESATDITAGGLVAPVDFSQEYDREGLNRVFNRQIQYLTVEDSQVTPESDYFDIGSILQDS